MFQLQLSKNRRNTDGECLMCQKQPVFSTEFSDLTTFYWLISQATLNL